MFLLLLAPTGNQLTHLRVCVFVVLLMIDYFFGDGSPQLKSSFLMVLLDGGIRWWEGALGGYRERIVLEDVADFAKEMWARFREWMA